MGENGSSRKEVTAQETPPLYYPVFSNFHQVIRAILRCLGLETHHNPSSSPKKSEDHDGKLGNHNINQAAAGTCQEGDLSPSATDYSDPPPSTVTDPPADYPPASTGSRNPGDGVVVSLSAPRRPETRRGSGPQIN